MAQEITLKDIAREANLSVAAVSKALAGYPHISESTRERVRTISDRLNYKPRPRRRTGKSERRVGVMLIEVDRMSRYSSRWLTGLTQAAGRSDVRLELSGIDRIDEHNPLATLRDQAAGLDALLLFGCIKPAVLEAAGHLGVPCVVVGDIEPDYGTPLPAVHRVNTDKLAMGQFATRALIEQGHERIGFFCAPYPAGGWNDQWMTGYRLALIRAGLSDEPAIRPVLDAVNRHEVGADAARYMLELDERPTAYVAPTVRGAARFLETMAEHGVELGPDQLIVGGRADEARDYGLGRFPLVCENVGDMAVRAVDLLSRLADGEQLPPAEVLVPYSVRNIGSNPSLSAMEQL